MQEISTVKLHAITRIILGRYRLRNVALALVARCPLLAQSGHAGRAPQCPLLGVKRTQSAVAEHTFKSSLRICEGVCPAGVTSLIKSGALSGREPLHERLGAFENLGRSGDPR